ncbi:MAG: substrate-binding domain-containing protein [Candidatus Limnocylindrales bacterium]
MPRQPRDPERVTIREIARTCGVSVQTVSRVINRRPDVAPGTRAAVEAAIAAAGFQPSAVARSLVQRRSYTLGIIAAGLRYFGVAQTLNGITEESEGVGYALLLKEVPSSGAVDVLSVIEFLMAHRVEGIIVAAPDLGEADVRRQLPPATPPIVFLKSEPSPAFSTILIDNYGGARQATGHLIALGRTRIAHLAGPLEWHEARDRKQGWRDALRDAGLDPGATAAGNWSAESGAEEMARLLDQAPDLDAVFVANDQMALAAMAVLHERGIDVPGRVAVVGFDGLEEGAYFTPSLTTIRQPLRELGQLAVREVLAAVNGPSGRSPVHALTLATELVVRASAPAPGTVPSTLVAPNAPATAAIGTPAAASSTTSLQVGPPGLPA